MNVENVKQKRELRGPRNNSPILQLVVPKQQDIDLIKRAADIYGASVSGFVRAHTIKAARRIVRAEELSEARAVARLRDVTSS